MRKAPNRIWAQDAEPSECHYIGGGWWDDECGNTQYPHMVEYVRADLYDELVEALRRVVEQYDETNPAVTADWHGPECGCLRCEIDFARAALAKHTTEGEK